MLAGVRDGKEFVHRWGDDAVAALPEVFRVAVSQIGIVPFDAERFKRPHIFRERLGATEPGVEVVDLRDDKNGSLLGVLNQRAAESNIFTPNAASLTYTFKPTLQMDESGG